MGVGAIEWCERKEEEYGQGQNGLKWRGGELLHNCSGNPTAVRIRRVCPGSKKSVWV